MSTDSLSDEDENGRNRRIVFYVLIAILALLVWIPAAVMCCYVGKKHDNKKKQKSKNKGIDKSKAEGGADMTSRSMTEGIYDESNSLEETLAKV